MNDRITAGIAFTGSYCTFSKAMSAVKNLAENNINLIPVFSDNSSHTDSRFGKAADFIAIAEKLTGNTAITTIAEAEPIGPKKLLDILIIAPCTGNTIAKLANGIADTTVTLAAKSQLRNNRPIVIGISTNDGLGANAANIGKLLARKHIYMVPFGQDDCYEKENSLISDFNLILPTVEYALNGRQYQPLLLKN